MYIHGFGSSYRQTHPKVKTLEKVLPKYLNTYDRPAKVMGMTIDYCNDDIINVVKAFVIDNEIDLIIGTSMGGWTASHVGEATGVPFVAINPAINPRETMKRHIDESDSPNMDFIGRPINMSVEFQERTFEEPMNIRGGLFIVDDGDELFDYKDTVDYVGDGSVIVFEGGSHRFDHMEQAIPFIAEFWNSQVDGLDKA